MLGQRAKLLPGTDCLLHGGFGVVPSRLSAVLRGLKLWPMPQLLAQPAIAMPGCRLRRRPCSKTRHRFWFENPTVARPIREDAGSLAAGGDQRLFPRECREAVGWGWGARAASGRLPAM